jgi:transcriptional regulator with XRE-family HTH domain
MDEVEMVLRGFGARLAYFRLERGLTQPQLASLVGIGESEVSRYENGHHLPRLEGLVRLAIALEVSLDRLVMGDMGWWKGGKT